MKKKVLVGLSWPYANGRLHIGHVASSLPADVLARFYRVQGDDVSFVTGSDCFGTPILVQAGVEGIKPEQLAEKYHKLLEKDFRALGFTFDNYSKTMSKQHLDFVGNFHRELYKGKYIFEKTAPQLYCEKCKKYLPDRYVEGVCPHCKNSAKGDSCDHCGKILEPEDLVDPKCKLCGTKPVVRDTTQLYLKLSALQPKIQKFFDQRKGAWTANAQGLTQRYLNEGLHDRAITRSMEWGVPIPRDGWDDKRIYIWAENVLGYLSASKPEFWSSEKSATPPLHYYIHAKDNIPFHSVILPGLILANEETNYHLPDVIIASEYVTLEGHKISKSKGNVLTAEELLNEFDVDMIRFYFLRQAGGQKDSNFTFEDFVNVVNGELVNNFGNLVNRTLSFVINKFGGQFAHIKPCRDVQNEINNCGSEAFDLLEKGCVQQALKRIMELVNFGNKYFADNKPWVTNDVQIIGEVVEIIRCATSLLGPFIPDASQKVLKWLEMKKLDKIDVLWQRLDMKAVKEKFAKYCKGGAK
ncbi:MAG: methionine--tRNA ligase [Christensenellaceae bacterium]|nr:methionine--tRNA ligase [Christensenellaceae bacterium]